MIFSADAGRDREEIRAKSGKRRERREKLKREREKTGPPRRDRGTRRVHMYSTPGRAERRTNIAR